MLLTEVINKTSELLTLLMRFSIQTAEIRIKNLPLQPETRFKV
jgi:hypothetical protein